MTKFDSKKFLVLAMLWLTLSGSYAVAESVPAQLKQAFTYLTQEKPASAAQKIAAYSQMLLGIPFAPSVKVVPPQVRDIKQYVMDLLQKPEFNYTFEHMDCVHYVEIVLALTLVPDVQQWQKQYNATMTLADFQTIFEANLKKIRYKNGRDTFIMRNHFTSLDWIPNNSSILRDITAQLMPHPIIASAKIDKCGFIYMQPQVQEYVAHLVTKQQNFTKRDMKNLLKRLGMGQLCNKTIANVAYIPLPELFENYAEYVKKFPQVTIVNIVRPNWDLTKIIGSHLNISHIGFVTKQGSQLLLSHSSRDAAKVKTVDFLQYLQEFSKEPTIKGINVLEFIEQK